MQIIRNSSFQVDRDAAVPSLDIRSPETPVEIEYDSQRRVLYISVEGITLLRVQETDVVLKRDNEPGHFVADSEH